MDMVELFMIFDHLLELEKIAGAFFFKVKILRPINLSFFVDGVWLSHGIRMFGWRHGQSRGLWIGLLALGSWPSPEPMCCNNTSR